MIGLVGLSWTFGYPRKFRGRGPLADLYIDGRYVGHIETAINQEGYIVNRNPIVVGKDILPPGHFASLMGKQPGWTAPRFILGSYNKGPVATNTTN